MGSQRRRVRTSGKTVHGLGPASVAVLADYGFGDRARLNFACAIAVPIAAGALLFIFGRRAYLAMIDRLDTAEGTGSALASGLPRNVA